MGDGSFEKSPHNSSSLVPRCDGGLDCSQSFFDLFQLVNNYYMRLFCIDPDRTGITVDQFRNSIEFLSFNIQILTPFQ